MIETAWRNYRSRACAAVLSWAAGVDIITSEMEITGWLSVLELCGAITIAVMIARRLWQRAALMDAIRRNVTDSAHKAGDDTVTVSATVLRCAVLDAFK